MVDSANYRPSSESLLQHQYYDCCKDTAAKKSIYDEPFLINSSNVVLIFIRIHYFLMVTTIHLLWVSGSLIKMSGKGFINGQDYSFLKEYGYYP